MYYNMFYLVHPDINIYFVGSIGYANITKSKFMETIRIQYYRSPYGELMLGSLGDKLCLCDWVSESARRK